MASFGISERIHLYRKEHRTEGIRIRIVKFKISERFVFTYTGQERKGKQQAEDCLYQLWFRTEGNGTE
jgi:hypothetical protein